jgi:hypothetical protein
MRLFRRLLAVVLVAGLAYLVYRVTRPGEPDLPIIFTDVTAQAGITFRHVNGAAGDKLLPETMSGGVAVIDFDRDGWPDLFFVNARPWPGQPGRVTQALYRNRRDGTFQDVTEAAGLAIEPFGMGAAVGDIDNDGWPDLFITAVGGNRLFRNRDGKKFEEITTAAGFPEPRWPDVRYREFLTRSEPMSFPASAAFFDYDGDGRLDLFVCNYVTWSPAFDFGVRATLTGGGRAYVPPQQFPGTHCQLFRNRDGRHFEDVSVSAGIEVNEFAAPGRPPAATGKSLGVVVCDPDRDGWPDLIVANDTVRNFYFHNVPAANGTRRFEEQGHFAGLAYADARPRGGMGIDAAELAGARFSVVVANFSNEPDSLFERAGENPVQFVDRAADAGLAGPSREPMKFGALLADFDRDGRLDLLTCNGHLEPDIARAQPGQTYKQTAQLFKGLDGGKFELIGAKFPAMVGRGCAYLDYDGDGDLDLVLVENGGPARLFRNDSPPRDGLRLLLTGTVGNRDAIGAEIEVENGGKTQRWFVSPTHGYQSQCERTTTFGVSGASRVTVRWPGPARRTQEWHDLAPGKYELIEGEPAAR